MQRWKQMIEQLLDRTITAAEFVTGFMEYRREEIHRGQLPTEAQAEANMLRGKIYRIISFRRKKHIKSLHELCAKYPLDPPSWVGHPIIEALFYEADAYWGDPETFDPDWNITEDQLREAAQKALDELNTLSLNEDFDPNE